MPQSDLLFSQKYDYSHLYVHQDLPPAQPVVKNRVWNLQTRSFKSGSGKKLELFPHERDRLFNRIEDGFNISFSLIEEQAIKTPYDLINVIMEKRMQNGSEFINHFLFSGRNTLLNTSDHSHFM